MPGGKPGARLDKTGVPRRNRHRQTGTHYRPLPRPELRPFTGGQVKARVARVGADGDDRVFAETLERQLDHLTERAGSSRASARR